MKRLYSHSLALFIGIVLLFLPGVLVTLTQQADPFSTNMTSSNDLKYYSDTTSSTAAHPRIHLRESDPLPPPIYGTLRLVFLSDTHGRHDEIPLPLPEGDILFHLGDASDRGNMSDMRAFVRWMKRNSFLKERIVIDGNHDRDHPLTGRKRDFMAEYEGVATVVRNEVVEVAGGKMAVVGVTWDACQSENFTEATHSIRNWIASGGDGDKKVDLVLSHYPPYVKGGGRGWHGSGVLSDIVNYVNPPLHCFGHIHFARGVRAYNSDITMVNCASTWSQPVVVDYCPHRKRAVMIHCPVPPESVEDHLRSDKFPKEFLVTEEEMEVG